MYEHTPNLKHTIANKGSMKGLLRFIQIEMKENDYYLANWAWLKGRDNQDELATWHKIFHSSSPTLEFCKAKSGLDGCDSMLHDDWLDIPWVIIVRPFCFKPRMVSDNNTRRNIFHNYVSMLISQGYHSRRWKLILSSESAGFRTKARPRETF